MKSVRRLALPFPTRRLALLVFATAPLWLLPSGVHVVAWIATMGIIYAAALDGLLLARSGEVSVERELPDSVGITESAEGEYRLQSRARMSIHAQLFDSLPLAAERTSPPSQELILPPQSERVLPLAVTGRARGRWQLGPVALRVRSRAGLAQRTLRYNDPDANITVTPSIAGVRRFRLLTMQHRLRDAGVRSVRRRGGGTTFANLREYQTGDDPRHIDWKATARRRELITREFTVEQGQTIMIAVDAGRMMTQYAGDLPRFEYALSSTLVLADIAASSGDRVGLIVFDNEIRSFVPPASGRGAVARLREALIPVVPSMAEPDYALAFRTLGTRHRKRSLIVLFTDVIDVRASQSLIAHTARSAARHLPLVVALRNEQLLAAAEARTGDDLERLYERAASEELLQAREEALTRMRRAGVSVLDVAPEAMAAAVINRYLELKGRSSL